MFRNKTARRRARSFAYGATGIGLVMLVVVPTTLASAASRSETTQVAAHCIPYVGTSLTGFVAAAELSWPLHECLSAPGESLSTASTARINTPAVLNFEEATVTGMPGLKGALLGVGQSAAGTWIKNVTLDQGSGSSNGINCNGTCTVTASSIDGMKGDGIYVSGKRSDGSVIGGSSVATEVSTVGTRQAGVMFNDDADVTVGYVTSSYDNQFGVFFSAVSAPCSATSIIATDLGQANSTWGLSTNYSGAGLELIGTGTTSGTGCSFQSVTDSGNGGYGIALTNASYNTFTSVSVTGEAKGELNSGINIATSSAYNTFTEATVSHEATAVDIGDNGVSGGKGEGGNNDNTFTTLNVSGDSYGSISITGGSDNAFKTVTGTDEGNDADGKTFYLGLIQFQYQATELTCDGDTLPCPVSGNTVTNASFAGPPMASWDTAKYVVYADADPSGNAVTLASSAPITYTVSPCSDTIGDNFKGCAAPT